MRAPWRWGLLLLALLAAAGAGFVAGRRLPRGLLARLRGVVSPTPTPSSSWAVRTTAPLQLYESPAAVLGGSLYLFGGFQNARAEASNAVWALDLASGEWSRKGDLPSARTHVIPARLGEELWFAGGFLGNSPGPVTDEVWRYDWRNDRWSPGPRLPVAIGSGALVSLEGKLHFFGGYLADRNTGSPHHWVYDPADTLAWWTPRAPLPASRGHMSAIALDGGIYALGGCIGHDPDPVDVALVHRYDPRTDRWTAVAPLPFPRSHFESSTLIRAGRIVIAGGRSRPTGRETIDHITEYDPRTDRWTALAPLPVPLLAPVAVLQEDRLLVGLGGRQASIPDNPTFWLEEPGPWQSLRSLPLELGEVAGGVIRSRLYLVGQGGGSTLALDLTSGEWSGVTAHAVRPSPGNHHAAEVWQGRLYLFGGLTRGHGAVQIYDPATDTWTRGPSVPFATGSAASATIGSQIYLAGGIVNDTTTRLAVRYDPAAATWHPIAPMPLARNHAAAGTDGRRLYVFGGRGPGSGDNNVVANGFAEVQIYDPATDSWQVTGSGPAAPQPLPQARGGMGKAVFAGGEFWVFGGETLDGPGATANRVYDRVDVYDPVANRWRAGPPLPTARHGSFPLLVGERIYVLGGGTRAGHSASTVAEVLDLRRAQPARSDPTGRP